MHFKQQVAASLAQKLFRVLRIRARDGKIFAAVVLQVKLKKHKNVDRNNATELWNHCPGDDKQAFSCETARLRLDLVEKPLELFGPTLRWN